MAERSLAGKNVLVTGGAGFIGSHLVDRIAREKPAKLVALDNLWLGRRENLKDAKVAFPKLKLVVQDATKFAAMKKLLREHDIDVVFDLATIPLPASLERPRWASEHILEMATVISELARLEEFETLVHCSSSEAYGSAQYVPMDEAHPLAVETPYAAAKAGGDLVVRSYWQTFGIDARIVRPFNNYGPRQNEGSFAAIIPIMLRKMRAGEPITIFGDGEQTRDFMYVTDTADGLVRAYEVPEAKQRTLNIATGKETTINDLVTTFCRLAGYQKPIARAPARPGDVRRHLADITLARKILGFAPKVSLEEGLKRTLAWSKRGGSGGTAP